MQRPSALHTIAFVRPVAAPTRWPLSLAASGRWGPGFGATRLSRGVCGWLAAGTAVLALQVGVASVALGDVPTLGEQVKALGEQVNAVTQIGYSCSPTRFRGEPEYFRVRMNDGVITSIHLLRTDDGKEVMTSHPYGAARAIVTEDTRELCMKVDRLEGFVDRVESRRQRLLARLERIRRVVPRFPSRGAENLGAGTAAAGPPGDPPQAYNTGLTIGWNDSTGSTPGECHNFYIETPADNAGDTNFSSAGTASSVAEQTKVSATIAGAYGAFSASASFAYSDKWKASANSGSAYFNLSSVWNLSVVVDKSNPLNAFGQQAESNGTLATMCGLRHVATVPAGMVATLSVHFGSSSESTSSDINTQFTAHSGLDTIKAAVDVSKQAESSASYFDINLYHQGGGVTAGSQLSTGFANSSSDRSACEQGDGDACTDFVSDLTSAASTAQNTFNVLAQNPAAGADLSFFTLFPNGVAGVSTKPFTTASVPLPGGDVLEPYKDQIEQYLTAINEIATLSSRASQLNSLMTGSRNPYNREKLDIAGYLDRLIDDTEGAVSYATSREILLNDLGACLAASSTNVEEVCSPIINGGETLASAYDFYDADHGYPECTNGANTETCWFLQQNTIALQYAATFEVATAGSWAEDVIYIDELPPFDGPYNIDNIGGFPALVAFADRPYYYFGDEEKNTNVSILALEKDTEIADIYTSVVGQDAEAFEWFGIWLGDDWYEQSGDKYGRRTKWTSSPCTPTFAEPCSINFEWSYPPSKQVDLLQATDPIEGFFTP